MTPVSVRAHPLVLGIVMFLSSELMLFAALFATYYDLRATHTIAWPPPDVHLDLLGGSVGTFLLALSSAVMLLVTRAMDRNNYTAARWWVLSGITCALGFVYIAVHGYVFDTFDISSNAYGSIYYLMTGTHLAHVCVGIAILTALIMGMRTPALRHACRAGAEAMMYYWHFVFIVWIGIFTSIYIVR